ncbi:RrF2 family transcriptional regulator [Limimaricola cinnabarinus]|jgi:Rrf2 family nitric oxide-sensitive transcriptional repressor|uniref:Nitrite-sensitive transcriptional repressor NsrR n=1 Tax=Limimaricola cinnabarinus LL-001 TaxID=1337093 RepID=U3AQJ1_9RHOB|nr:Rrf2 family transcriptional regulator [Limimaricola cinnabarinus]GAD57003.1 nitrite-sensitive transcriptional repressor NsrR [Limimaricola cinnabarinus LL-001]
MKLSHHSDYALRTMIQLATSGDELVSIRHIAQTYGISHNHLMKIVQGLGRAGFIETVRGRHGGLRLARPASEISLGALVRHTEGENGLVDCTGCLIAPACGLPSVLAEAMQAFLAVLDGYRLSDVASRSHMLRALFDIPTSAAPSQHALDPAQCHTN